MEEKLLPCPFCGSKPYLYRGKIDGAERYRDFNDTPYKIHCVNCGTEMKLNPRRSRNTLMLQWGLYDEVCASILVAKWNYRIDANNLKHE